MRDQFAGFEEGPRPASSHMPLGVTVGDAARGVPRAQPEPQYSYGFGPRPVRADQLRTLRAALRENVGPLALPVTDDEDIAYGDGDADAPTNVYLLAQYMYQVSINAVTMADHELGLLLPRSGRIWFNARLFSDVPRGRELVQRDIWWRVVDTSPAVRFLLGWCIGLYRTANFRHVAHEQLPGWSRILSFSPTLPDCTKARVKLWSDVVRDVTELFAPANRIWRQAQVFTPIRAGDRRWQARLALANHRVEDVLHFLADRNNCPATLIRRALDGNPDITSYEEYLAFAESILEDLPRLRMQRLIAMRNDAPGAAKPEPGGNFMARLPAMFQGKWLSEMDDPRHNLSFWQLHL